MPVTSLTVKDGAGANQTVYTNSDPTTGAGQGALTETAPVTDTGSSGLNGRLQRVAQNLTSLIAKFTLGTGIATGAIRTVLASDSALPTGANIVGKVGIDQTTDGTTNLVAAKQSGTWNVGSITTLPATPAGSAIMGKVGIDQTTPGTTNGVQVNAALPAGTNLIGRVKPEGDEYETVAASQTAQILGAAGATGDYISGVLVIPATTTPGVVTLLDNAISIPLFVGGASSVSSLVPFFIPLGMASVSGAWKLTTGANVSAIGIGNFT